ncbi:hypothetical protein CRUP_003231 [Coryphaenoides rupestris]|nr:hypothetical protein CRUP_003231 [Coryphaenoides rupestris]
MFVDKENKTNSEDSVCEEPLPSQGLQPPAVVGRGWAGHLDTRTLRHLDPVCSSMAGIRLWFLLSVLYATRSDAWFWTNKDPEPKTTTTERSSVGSGDPKENRKSSHSRGTNSGGLLVEEPSLNQTGGGERTREQGGPNFLPVPSDWPICRHRKYFSLPNYFNHTTAEEVEAFLKQWEWLVRDGCYRNSEWFLCLLATPKHPSDPAGNGNRSTAMLPARRHLPCCSFCHHLQDSCWAKLEGSDFPVDCDSLPTEAAAHRQPGVKGERGSKGDKGNTGDQGPVGPKGDSGSSQGSTSQAGGRGDKALQGPPAPQGLLHRWCGWETDPWSNRETVETHIQDLGAPRGPPDLLAPALETARVSGVCLVHRVPLGLPGSLRHWGPTGR